MQYIGYLRRNPNDAPDTNYAGYDFWLDKLNQHSLPGEDMRIDSVALAASSALRWSRLSSGRANSANASGRVTKEADSQMTTDWSEKDTTTHQDHVIAHVIGATVLGYFIHDEALYVLLDIGFIWMIYVDGEMGLLPHPVAVGELDADEEKRSEIQADIELLLREGLARGGIETVHSCAGELFDRRGHVSSERR